MKCWICKREADWTIREFVTAKNRREKDGFRDVCLDCYKRRNPSARIVYQVVK